VISVELLSVIRRWSLREGKSIREIARRTGLSRVTIRKYLKSGTVHAKYARRQNTSKLDAFAESLANTLASEARAGREQRRNLRRIYADLVKLGYNGSHDRVAAFARHWRQEKQDKEQTSGRGTSVPLRFLPGEAFQFDWSEDWAVIGGGAQQADGGAVQAVLQPDLYFTSLSAADP